MNITVQKQIKRIHLLQEDYKKGNQMNCRTEDPQG